jgi:hypothetical protein
MLDDVLGRIGLHQSGTPLEYARLREPFSSWLQQQIVPQEDFAFLVSLVAAFISEYLIYQAGAQRYLAGQQIRLRLPVQSGVAREFDPYAAAAGLVRERHSLASFLATVST